MSTDVAVIPQQTAGLFPDAATPHAVIEAATEASNELAAVIQKQQLYQRIGRKQHVLVEGWQTLGAFVRVFATKDGGIHELPWPTMFGLLPGEPEPPGREPRRAAPEYDEWKVRADRRSEWELTRALHSARGRGLAYGFTASYRAIKDGVEVGWGEGRCTRDEPNWREKPDYQLSSMAQTRGQSKALRQPLGFIVSLAGYDPTPADEMPPSTGGSEPVIEAMPVLDDDAISEIGVELQRIWPSLDGTGFMRVLTRRMDGAIPEPVGTALRAWAWWAGRPLASEADEAQTPPDEPSEPSEPPTEE